MKTRIFAIFISFSFTLLLAVLLPVKEIAAEENPIPPMDIIILVDVSGSMRFTDPERIVLWALADFIDKLAPDGSRVGIIGFNGHIQHRIPFTLTDVERKAWLREQLSQFVYAGYTDIGLAFMYAIDMIEDVTELNNPLIIFTSDGYIQISRLNPRRTAQMSYADVEAALDALDGVVPVYTIGMHNPDGIDVPLLEMIASRSGGLSKFTYHAEELPGILAEIFEHHLERSRVDIEEEVCEIPEAEVEVVGDEDYDYAVEDEEPQEVYEEVNEEEVYENETAAFEMGALHYLAIFFGLTALLGVLRFVNLVL